MLARQLRLRLVASDDSDVPRNLQNMVVSIHAIATFQALHDYLRPRVAGLLGSSLRLSGMFAALAASGLMGSSTKPQVDVEATTKPSNTSPTADARTSISSSAQSTAQRRRSQRLAKQPPALAPSEIMENNSVTDDAKGSTPVDTFESTSSAGATIAPSELAPTEMVVDTELQAEFSDDEDVDAEVFDDDLDPDNSVSEKTINLSIAEG